MKIKLFLDTNILISGIFFEGNESEILDLSGPHLITCEDAIDELYRIAKKKFCNFHERTFEIALMEIERALYDINIIPKAKYQDKIVTAKKLISHDKDIPILAAAIYAKADYLLTGDSHFFSNTVRKVIKIRKAKEFLDEIKGRKK
ncbi:MAG: hypothetical protein A2Y62_11805 [Candidatus Fischerbacteria bacterium RBG_13_37_8]|uniref:PIN domain-containing protein n=1 Tax=Candidatus Fischerbacteria bacterium RBG_13_37_8 TaxID=1817863 RepID=A0A1F5VVA9_9BACT|nr:MAG: hypothetical protein A2Y62_11805 [Candidatus Fischerbacteria bacterium RBG_13_37_8]